jgi:hypothetical protein
MKKYYKDYKLVSKTLTNGKVKQVAEYIGKYYICQLSETDILKHKLYYLTLALCSGATAIGVGFLGIPGDKVAYVALPYVSLFLPIVFNLMGTILFAFSGNKLEQAAYDKTKIRIHRSTIWQIVLSCLASLGNIIFTFFKGNKDMYWKNWVFTGCMLLVLAINIVFLQLQKRVTYQVEDPNYNVLL